MIVEGNACIDLREEASGEPCGPGGTPGGQILVDGALLVRENRASQARGIMPAAAHPLSPRAVLILKESCSSQIIFIGAARPGFMRVRM
jgi:hypothetical protein